MAYFVDSNNIVYTTAASSVIGRHQRIIKQESANINNFPIVDRREYINDNKLFDVKINAFFKTIKDAGKLVFTRVTKSRAIVQIYLYDDKLIAFAHILGTSIVSKCITDLPADTIFIDVRSKYMGEVLEIYYVRKTDKFYKICSTPFHCCYDTKKYEKVYRPNIPLYYSIINTATFALFCKRNRLYAVTEPLISLKFVCKMCDYIILPSQNILIQAADKNYYLNNVRLALDEDIINYPRIEVKSAATV